MHTSTTYEIYSEAWGTIWFACYYLTSNFREEPRGGSLNLVYQEQEQEQPLMDIRGQRVNPICFNQAKFFSVEEGRF